MAYAGFRRGVVLPLALMLGACDLVTPDLTFTEDAAKETGALTAWSAIPEARPTATLTDLIGAPALDALVKQALAANPGLQQTLLTLRIRQAQMRETRAAERPVVEAGYSARKTEDVHSTYTGTLSVSWELDLWQKLADATEAAGKDVAEQEALYQSARDTLAAEVMQAWISLIADRRAIAIAERRLASLSQTEAFILQRYSNGLGDLEDLDTARSSAASARASLEEARETLEQQRRSLREMLGRTAGDEGVTVPEVFPEVIAPLADVPSQTLTRRPDLKAAYAAIEAETLRTDVAYKDLLPSISLSATLEDMAEAPTAALMSGPVWSLLGQLTAPLYRGGALRAAAEVAELQTAQAYQAYRETLVTAVREVEDTLGQERALAKRQEHITEALAIARRTLEQYEEKYRAGLVDILDLLSVQQSVYDLEAQLNDLIQQRLSNRVDMGLSLGLGVEE